MAAVDSVKRVVPALRRGVLLELDPSPSKRVAAQLVNSLKSEWARRSGEFFSLIADQTQLPRTDLDFSADGKVARYWEGQTLVLDFPRVLSSNEKFPFDTRLCFAICTKKSTKIWSRVSLPYGYRTSDAIGTPLSTLSELIGVFRPLAIVTLNWALSLALEVVGRSTSVSSGVEQLVEVTALGIRDHRLKEPFESLAISDLSAEEFLSEPAVDRELSAYANLVANLNGPLSLIGNIEPESFWFSAPATVEVNAGVLQNRELLYLVRAEEGGLTQAIGLGYDDSAMGDLANRSAIKTIRSFGELA